MGSTNKMDNFDREVGNDAGDKPAGLEVLFVRRMHMSDLNARVNTSGFVLNAINLDAEIEQLTLHEEALAWSDLVTILSSHAGWSIWRHAKAATIVASLFSWNSAVRYFYRALLVSPLYCHINVFSRISCLSFFISPLCLISFSLTQYQLTNSHINSLLPLSILPNTKIQCMSQVPKDSLGALGTTQGLEGEDAGTLSDSIDGSSDEEGQGGQEEGEPSRRHRFPIPIPYISWGAAKGANKEGGPQVSDLY